MEEKRRRLSELGPSAAGDPEVVPGGTGSLCQQRQQPPHFARHEGGPPLFPPLK